MEEWTDEKHIQFLKWLERRFIRTMLADDYITRYSSSHTTNTSLPISDFKRRMSQQQHVRDSGLDTRGGSRIMNMRPQSSRWKRSIAHEQHEVFEDDDQVQSSKRRRSITHEQYEVFEDDDEVQSTERKRSIAHEQHTVFEDDNQVQSSRCRRSITHEQHEVFEDGDQVQSSECRRSIAHEQHEVFEDNDQVVPQMENKGEDEDKNKNFHVKPPATASTP